MRPVVFLRQIHEHATEWVCSIGTHLSSGEPQAEMRYFVIPAGTVFEFPDVGDGLLERTDTQKQVEKYLATFNRHKPSGDA